MNRFGEASLEELSQKFPQIPNRKLTIENGLEDIHETQELLKQIKEHTEHILKKEKVIKKQNEY